MLALSFANHIHPSPFDAVQACDIPASRQESARQQAFGVNHTAILELNSPCHPL